MALRRIDECRSKGKGGTILDLSTLGLTRVPLEIGQLSALEELYLHDNQLAELPLEISQLSALEALSLDNNQLTTLPLEVTKIPALTTLAVAHNQLTTLPPEIGRLSDLTRLYVENNRLSELPPEMALLKNLQQLYLQGNPALGLPPEVLGPTWVEVRDKTAKRAKPQKILDYYFDSLGKKGMALREVKVILVGRGEVGKSSMADALQKKKFVKNRKRTDGIAITPWPVTLPDGDATLLLWDFGGQEIMHGTHQFFLTHRSLYVVMVDGRHDRAKQDAEYWLKLVRAFGGDSTVLVVMNRQKAHPFDIDRQYLADKYGVKLEHFFRTDCERAMDIKPLRDAIFAAAAGMLKTEERFPAKCWDVKTRLGEMKQHREDYLSDEDYAALCREHGVDNQAEQQKLLKRLADLGTVVSFPDEMKLAELTVLNPEWVTDGIYRVITDEALCEQKHGHLTLTKLRSILPKDRWPKPRHLKYLLDLMEKFELCFPVEDAAETVLVPELLPDVTPPLKGWEAAKCVVFIYRYHVLPHGVLPRFITRTHTLGGGKERWRSGVVLVDDGAEALIKADYEANTISVWVRGQFADARRALLKVVRHHFDVIHSRIKDLNPTEHVTVPGHPTVTVPYLDALQDERDRKVSYRVTIDGKRVDKSISDLLNGVATRQERDKLHRRSRHEPGSRQIIIESGAAYHEHHEDMSDDHSIHMRDNYGQAGQTLTNCTNMIQQQAPTDRKELLEAVEREVQQLIKGLPKDKQMEAAGDLQKIVEVAVSPTPPVRRWYSMSAEGLLEASKFAKDFTGNIAGTLKNLGKSLWPDFVLPDEK